ncbi:unnamed protein product, partial [Effrenium voratum]
GDVVVMSDFNHLGIYKGDQVLLVNDVAVKDLQHFAELLEQCDQEVEIHFYHKEFGGQTGEEDVFDTCCSPICTPQLMPMWCDFFFNPPEPRCRASRWPLREVLAASKASVLPSGLLQLRLHRGSLKQSFGLPLGFLPKDCEASDVSNIASEDGLLKPPRPALCVVESFSSETEAESPWRDSWLRQAEEQIEVEASPAGSRGTLVVLQPLPLLGLRQGDELVRINGEEITDLAGWKAATKHAMQTIWDFRRPSEVPALETVPLIKLPRKAEDLHSASSTKDCSRDAVPEEGGGCLFLKTCRSGRHVNESDSSRSQRGHLAEDGGYFFL